MNAHVHSGAGTPATSHWTVVRNGPVLVASFANGSNGYLDDQSELDLERLLDAVEADAEIRCVVLTGAEVGVFIRHYDVGVLVDRAQELVSRGKVFDIARPVPASRYLRLLDRIENMPVAFIAAINGVAMGGGFELALACDLRIALQGDYPLGLPEVNIGLLPGAGGTQRLPRLIGEGRALEMTLLGKTISPTEALALGVVTEVVAGDLMARAMALAEELAGKHARALACIKKLIRSSSRMPMEVGLAHERTLFCSLMVDAGSLQLMRRMAQGQFDIQDRRSVERKMGRDQP